MFKLIKILFFVLLMTFPVACNYSSNTDPDTALPGSDAQYWDYTEYSTEWKQLPGYIPDVLRGPKTMSMCWAISSANILEYSGWAVDSSEVLSILHNEFGNNPGWGSTAIKYYFSEYVPDVDVNTVAVAETYEEYVPMFIAHSINSGKPIHLTMDFATIDAPGHTVFVYAYKYNTTTDQWRFKYNDGGDSNLDEQIIVVYQKNGKWYSKYEVLPYVLRNAISLELAVNVPVS